MDPISSLIEYFARFPGVGPRQARRFAYYLLTRDAAGIKDFAASLLAAKKNVANCLSCMRLFSERKKTGLCGICSDKTRDVKTLMIVAHDVDVESIEKSASYKGYYFVLGGTITILEQKPAERIRTKKCLEVVEERIKEGLAEVILALDLNPEGEYTSGYVSKMLAPLLSKHHFKITLLGRGLSTGTELQYSDPETIQSALGNRKEVL